MSGRSRAGDGRPERLAAVQSLFWELIAAPEGVRPGMETLRRRGDLAEADLSFMIRGDERLAAEDRLDIYASMYFYRLRDCLAEDFPKVAAVVGGAEFHNLATDYLLHHPSRHWSLRYLGAPFADFLAGHRLGVARRDLADLARLEWARIEMFDAADAAPLTRERATAAGMDLTLALIPAATILSLRHNVAPLWRALEDAGAAGTHGSHSAAVVAEEEEFVAPALVPPAEERPLDLLVWRRAYRVAHRSIEPAEKACLEALAAGGLGLPALCELLLERRRGEAAGDEDGAAATREMAELLGRWLADGLLRA